MKPKISHNQPLCGTETQHVVGQNDLPAAARLAMIDLERGQIAGADSNTISEIARRFRIAAEASRAGRKPVTALVFDSLAAALDGDYARLARVAQ